MVMNSTHSGSGHCAFAALIASVAAFATPAFAQSDAPQAQERPFRVSAGVRVWMAEWDSWNVNPLATGVAVGDDRFEVVESRRGSQKAAVIPFVGLRYGALSLSASAMTNTDYKLHETATPSGFDVSSSRSERDLNVGYAFFPGVSGSIGYKQISQKFGPDEYQWRGPILGLSVGAPLSDSWGFYTSLGAGWLKGDFPIADVTGKTRFDADYRLAEVGFTYNFAEPVQWVRALVLTAGYRTQRMATKGYALAIVPSSAQGPQSPRQNTTGQLVDTTQGFVMAIQATF